MIKIRYKLPREVLGKWLAENVQEGKWPEYYNKDQQEYWFKKADSLLEFIKRNNLV